MFIQTTVDGDKAAQERFIQKRKGAGRKRMSQKGYGDTWKLIPLKKHHSIVCVCVCVACTESTVRFRLRDDIRQQRFHFHSPMPIRIRIRIRIRIPAITIPIQWAINLTGLWTPSMPNPNDWLHSAMITTIIMICQKVIQVTLMTAIGATADFGHRHFNCLKAPWNLNKVSNLYHLLKIWSIRWGIPSRLAENTWRLSRSNQRLDKSCLGNSAF